MKWCNTTNKAQPLTLNRISGQKTLPTKPERRDWKQQRKNDNRLEIGIRKFIEFVQTDCQDPAMDKAYNGNGKNLKYEPILPKTFTQKFTSGSLSPKTRLWFCYNWFKVIFLNRVCGKQRNSMLSYATKEMYSLPKTNSINYGKSQSIFQKTLLTQSKIKLGSTTKSNRMNSIWKLIYEYLEEDINLADEFEPFFFLMVLWNWKYQNQAAIQTKRFWKPTRVFSWLTWLVWVKPLLRPYCFNSCKGRTLVVCPPVLKTIGKIRFLISASEVLK